MRAKISVKREDIIDDEVVTVEDVETVDVDHIVSTRILINDNAGDEVLETLIPWHRVWEVWSTVEGEMYLASGR